MGIIIESVTNNEDEVAMLQLREQVFEREMGIVLDRLAALDDSGSFHLLALAGSAGDAVATLSVVDTSRHHELHNGYGLEFPPAANIPLMLMLEAHRRFVAPGQFDYAWLLFDSDRAASSLMCKWLGFTAGQHTCVSEYGRSRTLVRNERAPGSEQAIWRTEQYVAQRLKTVFSPERVTMQPANSA